jgi:hypothetical protein
MRRVMKRWLSPRAFLLHFELIIVAAGCGVATWWQAGRALSGNSLSWFYTFEWPVFVGIAAAAWWHLIHEDPVVRAERRQVSERIDPAERQAEW